MSTQQPTASNPSGELRATVNFLSMGVWGEKPFGTLTPRLTPRLTCRLTPRLTLRLTPQLIPNINLLLEIR